MSEPAFQDVCHTHRLVKSGRKTSSLQERQQQSGYRPDHRQNQTSGMVAAEPFGRVPCEGPGHLDNRIFNSAGKFHQLVMLTEMRKPTFSRSLTDSIH